MPSKYCRRFRCCLRCGSRPSSCAGSVSVAVQIGVLEYSVGFWVAVSLLAACASGIQSGRK